MTTLFIALALGILIGGVIAVLFMSLRSSRTLISRKDFEEVRLRAEAAEKGLEGERATTKHLDGRAQKLDADWRSAEEVKTTALQSAASLQTDLQNHQNALKQANSTEEQIRGQLDSATEQIKQLHISLAESNAQEKASKESILRLDTELASSKKTLLEETQRAGNLHASCVKLDAEIKGAHERAESSKQEGDRLRKEVEALKVTRDEEAGRANKLASEKVGLETALHGAGENAEAQKAEIERLRKEAETVALSFKEEAQRANQMGNENVRLSEELRGANERLDAQKSEIERIQKEFNTGFENLANRLLEEKSAKFVQTNKDSIEALLKPLGENLTAFKNQVSEVYDKESKERFSLSREVAKLAELNQVISKEANNLASALKGNSKTQGGWGEMILNNILERSGLTKGRDYLVQEFLKDADGEYVKNEENKRLQPDVLINYPDNRKVLIDAKASLTAFVKYSETESEDEKIMAIADHLKSIRKHIDELASKSYQDFTGGASLDFILMFIPSEPAYCIAMAEDSELWHYAYGKKVLLINPTNLIVVLKMTSEIWRREYQARNHQEIAKRGSILLEKFIGFVANLQNVGASLKDADTSYQKALSQLSEGNGNLIRQAESLRDLGVKAKKSLPSDLLERAGVAEVSLLDDTDKKALPSVPLEEDSTDLFNPGSGAKIKVAEGSGL